MSDPAGSGGHPSVKLRSLSVRGKLAHMRGLRTLDQLVEMLQATREELEDAPKAEWHHDTKTGRKVWMYDPTRAWVYLERRRQNARREARAKARREKSRPAE